SSTGNALGYLWTPPTGLSDPTILNPTATVFATTTYTLSVQGFDPTAPNLVTNPGFELGNTGFTSNYTYSATPITPGTYTITTSPSLVLATFPPCDDHTYGNGTGNMMLINGNASAGSQVWCQTIPVAQNTWYVMSAWAMCSPISPPELQFYVNSTPTGSPYPVATGTCNWQQFSSSWYSGSSSSATLCIVDQNGSGNGFFGDDYALDDIFMGPACTVSDQVTVSIADVNAVVPITAFLACNAIPAGIQLDGSASSSGPGITYLWNGPGIVSGGNTPIATVNQVGTYTLTVTLANGPTNCIVSASLDVLDDPNIVLASAAAPDDLTCVSTTVMLDGTGSSIGTTISYDWQPGFGVVSGQGTLNPEVNQQGLYTLTVTNSVSGCTATATAFVNQFTAQPVAMGSAPAPLTCTVSTVTLSGTGSTTGNNITYLWDGLGIVSGATTLNNCVVNEPGTYTLTVTNTVSECTAIVIVVVGYNGTPPTVAINSPGNLDCSASTQTLTSTGSSTGNNFNYAWTTPDGHFTGPVNGQTATVDMAGLYTLTITNSQNGCTASASVSVAADFTAPTASVATPAQINCLADSVMLDASASSGGAGFSFVWASQNGTFLSGDTTLTPWVGSAGNYTLTVTDTTNSCTAAATATVSSNTTLPVAQAGPPATLDCDGTALSLDGNGTSTGGGFSYEWTTSGGNILSGDTTLTPQVNGVGTYFLTVENAANGCTALDSVAVGQDANAPVVYIEAPSQLDCGTDELTLDASGSSAGANLTLTWVFTPAAGGSGPGFVSGDTTLTPVVNAPGTFALTLFNQTNNCEATASVTVTLDTLPPVADAGPAPTLDCTAQTAMLDGSGSSQGTQFSYLWSTGDTTDNIIVSNSGTYTLTVSNEDNGCTASDAVTVTPFGNLPNVDIVTPADLNCSLTQIQLSATASTGQEFSYNWTFTGTGTGIVSGEATLTPTVGSAGTYTLIVTNTLTTCTASASVQVEQLDDFPSADPHDSLLTLSCGLDTIYLLANAGAWHPNFTWSWTTLDGHIIDLLSLIAVVDAPGTYTFTVTDLQNGCTATDEVLVVQDANAPTADAGTPMSLTCTVLSVQLDGTGSSSGPGISYLWTTSDGVIFSGETTLTPVVTAVGTYLLTVTNSANNCQTLASVQVLDLTQPPVAVAAAPQSLTCTLQQVPLDGTGSSAGANFTYLWTGPGIVTGATTLSPVVDAPGAYTLAVSDLTNGCTALASVNLTENISPPTAVAVAPQSLDCTAQQVPLDGTGSSAGANFSYGWTGPGIGSGGTTLSPIVDAPGAYTLTVSDLTNGCTALASVNLTENINPPTAVAAAPQSLDCTLQQVPLNGTGSSAGANFSYLWTGAGIVSGATTLSPVVNLPGTYTLTVTNQTNGCTATASANLTENTTPPDADAGPLSTLSCQQSTATLQGSSTTPGAIFTWQTNDGNIVSGGNTANPVVDAPGLYLLTVTDPATGCVAGASVGVSLLFVDFPTVEITPPSCDVPTGSIEITGGLGGQWPYLFSIDGGASFTPDSLFENLQPAVYEMVVQDAGGCEQSLSVEVPGAPTLVVTLTASVTLEAGGTLQLNPQLNIPASEVASVVWSPGDWLDCTDCLRPTASPQGDITYNVLITSVDGCTASASISIQIELEDAQIYVPNAFSPNGDGINDVLVVFAKESLVTKVVSFQVFDRWGGTVFSGFDLLPNDFGTGWDGTHRGKPVDVGVYAWFAEVELLTGERRVLKGDVVVVR
ncbi:MAG: gliding motility-associated C-terminal domain-containing protein, partial [Bacteroidetes bacterium]|nr:gliding motility-associated C-terminal domain-containing protein [Bacteroidota bacterium]